MAAADKQTDLAAIRKQLKGLLVSSLSLEDVRPEDIKDDDPLFGDGLGLDSLDAVEIVVLLQRNFGLEVRDMEIGRKVFQSVNTLADYVYENTRDSAAGDAAGATT
jgi:acyl carrier protein